MLRTLAPPRARLVMRIRHFVTNRHEQCVLEERLPGLVSHHETTGGFFRVCSTAPSSPAHPKQLIEANHFDARHAKLLNLDARQMSVSSLPAGRQQIAGQIPLAVAGIPAGVHPINGYTQGTIQASADAEYPA